jgi:hypothetical protein
MFGQWRRNLLSRFGDREDVGKAKAYQHYWAELPEQDVMELFELLEMEYQLPPGLLRPGDNLNKLLEPVATANPLKWLLYRARTEDRTAEINYRLSKRQQRQGTHQAWQQAGIATVDDLVRAWCGQLPGSQTGKAGR